VQSNRCLVESGQRNVKLNLLLDEIAQKEKISVTDEDFSNYLVNYAMQTRRRPEDIVRELRNDRARINLLRNNIQRGKTVDWLIEKAEVTEVEAETTEAR